MKQWLDGVSDDVPKVELGSLVVTPEGVDKPVVVDVAGEHDLLLAGLAGDGAGAGAVATSSRVGVPLLVVAEPGEHPGAEHSGEAGRPTGLGQCVGPVPRHGGQGSTAGLSTPGLDRPAGRACAAYLLRHDLQRHCGRL
jgi:hypothetical protein